MNNELEIIYNHLLYEHIDRVKIGRSILDIRKLMYKLRSMKYRHNLVYKNKHFGIKSISISDLGYLFIQTNKPENLKFHIQKYGWINYKDLLDLHNLYKKLGNSPDDTENFRLTSSGLILSEFEYYNFVDTNNIHIENTDNTTVLIKLALFPINEPNRLYRSISVKDLIKISLKYKVGFRKFLTMLDSSINECGRLVYQFSYDSFKNTDNNSPVWTGLEYKDVKIKVINNNQWYRKLYSMCNDSMNFKNIVKDKILILKINDTSVMKDIKFIYKIKDIEYKISFYDLTFKLMMNTCISNKPNLSKFVRVNEYVTLYTFAEDDYTVLVIRTSNNIYSKTQYLSELYTN